MLSAGNSISAPRRGSSDIRTSAPGTSSTGMQASQDYKILLPPLPSGILALNTVFLHGDVSERPYRVEDFHSALQAAGVLTEILAIGPYQYNNVWMVTLHTLAAKHRLLQAAELTVKGKRCLVLDPNKVEVRVRLHWVPYHLPNIALREALEKFGKVEEITRETWRVPGFQSMESTTRNVRLVLHDGVTPDQVPHQLLLQGCTILAFVPGRAPLCLRCQKTGHIRRDCRVPRCHSCGRFGHVAEGCVRTYATVAGAKEDTNINEVLMDHQEAEEATASVADPTSVLPDVGVVTEASVPATLQTTAPIQVKASAVTLAPVEEVVVEAVEVPTPGALAKEVPHEREEEATTVSPAKEETSTVVLSSSAETAVEKEEEAVVGTPMVSHQSEEDAFLLTESVAAPQAAEQCSEAGMDCAESQGLATKRPLDCDPGTSSDDSASDPGPWKKATSKRNRRKSSLRVKAGVTK